MHLETNSLDLYATWIDTTMHDQKPIVIDTKQKKVSGKEDEKNKNRTYILTTTI